MSTGDTLQTMTPQIIPSHDHDEDHEIDEKTDKQMNDQIDEIDESIPWEERTVNGYLKVFAGSTHSYLIYYRHDRDTNGLIMSILVLMIQFILYSVILTAGKESIRRAWWVPLEIYAWACDGGRMSEDISDKDFSCNDSYNEMENHFHKLLASFALSCVLVSIFIQYDFLACIKIWSTVEGKWAKITAFIIFAQSIYAFYAGTLFATASVYQGSSYDAIVNCIGVLFVHDIDEKMFESTSLLNNEELKLFEEHAKWPKCCDCCKNWFIKNFRSLCTILVMIFSVIIGIIMFYIQSDSVVYEDDFRDYWADYWGWSWEWDGTTN